MWPDRTGLKVSCLMHTGPHLQLATHTCLTHTHPDVVGVDVVGSRYVVVHTTQDNTGGINWEGKIPLRSPEDPSGR